MPNSLTIAKLAEQLGKKQVSSQEITGACLDQIEKIDAKLHSFLHIDAEDALAQAKAADCMIARDGNSTHPPLLGIPVGMKDIIAVKGQPLTCASKIIDNFISPYNATVTQRLREAGAVLLGRLNMDEFAMGSSTENSALGPTRNPWNQEHTPGGSSGGSAAAVASDECIAALGSDTGGSIRQPAAFCGCVGLKPTYGRVSRFGLVAFASSLDQIGPITKTVEDAALLLEAISGHDPKDSTSIPAQVPAYSQALNADIRGLKIGLPKEYMVAGLSDEVKNSINRAVEHLSGLGAEIIDISLPHTEYAVATYYIIATAEASANLARFDGIRYGRRKEGKDPIELYCNTRGAGFGAEVKRRIILGTYALSSGYYDAYYLRAQKVRTLIRRDFLNAFEHVDAVVTPTTTSPAFKLGEKIEDPLQMYLTDLLTISCNLSGICGISIPCGFSANPQLPIGLQILGKPLDEQTILKIAHAYEQSTVWREEKPDLTAFQ